MKATHIAECVRINLEGYLSDLGSSEPDRMYAMLLSAVEKPLLEMVMQRTDHNQSKAAQWLGLNRNTLRKKLLEHKLIE
jgi:Fis family transcriptional regulator